MKKIFSIIITLVAAIDAIAGVSWTTPPPASVNTGQSYTVAASETHGSCVGVYVYIYKNGAQVASLGTGGNSGTYTVATSYVSTDNTAQTISYKAEGWYTVPMSGTIKDGSITASTVVVAPQPSQTTVTSADGSAYVGNIFVATAAGGSGNGAYVFQMVSGGTATGGAVTSDGRITATRAGTVLFRVMRLGDGNYADSAWSATYTVTFTLDPNGDQDGDGIPNWWELQYGLDPYNAADGSQGVASGAGYTNLEAYNLWIDPTRNDSDLQQRQRGSLSQIKLEVLSKGPGTVTFTKNGESTTYYFNQSEGTWEGEYQSTGAGAYFELKDDVEDQATITSTVSDYVFLARPDPLNPRITKRNIVLNDHFIDAATKQDVDNASGTLKIRASFAGDLPFGAVDTSRLEQQHTIQFGLGADRAGRPVGTLTFNAGNYYDIESSKASLVSFYPGPANQGIWSVGQLHTQVKGPAGYVDVQRSRWYYTIAFYASGSYPQVGSLLDFSGATPLASYRFDVSMPTLMPLAVSDQMVEGQTQSFMGGNALAVTMTRTTGADVKVLEFRTDWYRYKGPDNPTSMDGGITWHTLFANYVYAVHRQWPSRSAAAAKGGLTKISYKSRCYYYNGGQLTKYVVSTEKQQFSGSNDSMSLLYRELLSYADGDQKLENSPATQFIGSGSDQHPGYGRSNGELSINGVNVPGASTTIPSGGRTFTEYYARFFTYDTNTHTFSSDNLGSQPRLSLGSEKQTRTSFLDSDVGGNTDLVTSYTYCSDLYDGKTCRASETTTNGSTTIAQRNYSYQMGSLSGKTTVTKTTNAYSGNGSVLTTITRAYSARLGDTDFRDRPVSTTLPDGTKTSFAYQRGTLNGSTWSAGDSGPHLLIAQLDGKTGGSVTSYNGIVIDPLDLDPQKSVVSERILDSADRVLREATCVYTASGAFAELSSVYYQYDPLGNLTYKADGTGRVLYEAGFTGFRKDWEKDEQGITRSYIYDDYDRVYTMTRASASEGSNVVPATTTTYLYYNNGQLQTETISTSGVGDTLVTSYEYDTASRVTKQTLPGSLVTSIAYPSATTTTTTIPGNGTKTEVVYADGRPKSVSGTAVPDSAITYSYDSSTGNLSTVQTTAGQMVTTIADWLNRTLTVTSPTWGDGTTPGTRVVTNNYDATTGHLRSQTTTSAGVAVSPTHLFEYDAYGRLFRESATTSGNSTISVSSDYGVKEYDSGFQTGAPNGYSTNWYQYTRVKVYPYDGATAGTWRYGSQAYQQVSGLSSSTAAHAVVIDFDHNLTDSFTAIDRSRKRAEVTTTTTGTNQTLGQVSINGLVVKATNAQGQTTLQTYDGFGRLQASSDPRIGTTSYTYKNGSVLVETMITPDLHTTTLGYNSAGRVTSKSDQTGKAAYFQFDAAGNQTHQWGDTVNPARFEYNDLGQKTKMHTYRSGTWTGSTLPSDFGSDGDVTTWNYQAATGLLHSKVDADNKAISYTYNALGQIGTRTDARQVHTSYTYTPLNLLWTVSYDDGLTANLTYTYDRAGRTKTVTDAAGLRSFDYYDTSSDTSEEGDLLNKSARLKNENLPAFFGGHVLSCNYQYGVAGRANGATAGIKLDSGSLYNVSYDYDSVLRLSNVAYNNLTPFTYTFTDNSNLVATIEQLTSGSSWNYARDYAYRTDSNRLDHLTHAWGASNQITTQLSYYGLDGVAQANSYGLRATEKTSGSAYANLLPQTGGWGSYTNYSYTDRVELSASGKYQLYGDGSAGAALAGAARSYGFDAMGNRTADQNGSYTPNALNQYTATPFAGYVSYDANGNLKTDGARSYDYDAENRLIKVTQGSSVWNYKYDYLGRRIEKNGTGVATTRYLYDGWNLIAELDGSGTLTRRFVWGPDVSGSSQGAGGVGGLLVIDAYLGGSSASQYYPIYDASHNVLGLYDGNGNAAAAYQYDPFGNLQAAAGSYSTANPFRSATKYTDDETGLIYYGMRFYSPSMGRFINRDPIEEQGGINLYAFCGNDGVNRYDLLGMEGADPSMSASAQVAHSGFSTSSWLGADNDEKDTPPPTQPPVTGLPIILDPYTIESSKSDTKTAELSSKAAQDHENDQAMRNNGPNNDRSGVTRNALPPIDPKYNAFFLYNKDSHLKNVRHGHTAVLIKNPKTGKWVYFSLYLGIPAYDRKEFPSAEAAQSAPKIGSYESALGFKFSDEQAVAAMSRIDHYENNSWVYDPSGRAGVSCVSGSVDIVNAGGAGMAFPVPDSTVSHTFTYPLAAIDIREPDYSGMPGPVFEYNRQRLGNYVTFGDH